MAFFLPDTLHAQRATFTRLRLRKAVALKLLLNLEEEYDLYTQLLTNKSNYQFRRRRIVDEMYGDAGCYGERKFRMDRLTFEQLHNILRTKIQETLTMSSADISNDHPTRIDSSLRLSSALRFLLGVLTLTSSQTTECL